jgi:hypothetical protein
VRIALGTFACKEIEAQTGSSIAVGAKAAIADYARRLESTTPPIEVPSLPWVTRAKGAIDLELAVDPETEAILEREAARQGTTISQLVSHSVLVYLAEIDRLTPIH